LESELDQCCIGQFGERMSFPDCCPLSAASEDRKETALLADHECSCRQKASSEVMNLPTLEACGLFDLAQTGERKNQWIWERMGSVVPN
jgi:hypothetical protein